MNQHEVPASLRLKSCVAALVLSVMVPLAQAQQARVFAYPNAGQSQQQQQADSYQCHQWAVSQTGFDPTQAVGAPNAPQYAGQTPPPPPQQGGGLMGLGGGGMFKGGGMLGDAATGAALGAAGGALAGDAGKGAALGALAAGVLGAATRATNPQAQPQAAPPPSYQQQVIAQDQQRRQADYNAAFGACMKGRNYTVN